MTWRVMGSTVIKKTVSSLEFRVSRLNPERVLVIFFKLETRNPEPLVVGAGAQLAGQCFVESEVSISFFDSDTVDALGLFYSHVTAAHIVEHPGRIPLQRMAEAAAARSLKANDIAWVERVIRVA